MDRRNFLKTSGTAAMLTGIGAGSVNAFVPAHNWEKYDFGSGPEVEDRLYQGSFPQYAPELVVPGSSVTVSTMPSDKVLHNYCRPVLRTPKDSSFHRSRGGTHIIIELRQLNVKEGDSI
jgi:hypothetical protein